jgi:hypothetical protein
MHNSDCIHEKRAVFEQCRILSAATREDSLQLDLQRAARIYKKPFLRAKVDNLLNNSATKYYVRNGMNLRSLSVRMRLGLAYRVSNFFFLVFSCPAVRYG